jgi:MFS superfamily sulfate permease-like transporter
VVPEAMAYAGIAGLPPQAGLYTLVTSLLIFALLGTTSLRGSIGEDRIFATVDAAVRHVEARPPS